LLAAPFRSHDRPHDILLWKGPERPDALITASRPTAAAPTESLRQWRLAETVRDEWLAHALDTKPADRAATEAALTGIYARIGRPGPEFVWVDSPHAARPHLAGWPTLDDLYAVVKAPTVTGRRPLASDLAAALSRLRSALDERTERVRFDPTPPKRRKGEPWPKLAPVDALRYGVPFHEVARLGVREALGSKLTALHAPVRAALGPDRPVCWYGQLDAYWIAWHDLWSRMGLAAYLHADAAHLADWATLARSSGWWWPGEERCVVVERPSHLTPSRVTYRDGWSVG
jgi:hypothetical protein